MFIMLKVIRSKKKTIETTMAGMEERERENPSSGLSKKELTTTRHRMSYMKVR